MNSLDLYKSLYEAETTKFKELNEGVNAPITVLSLIVSMLYFIYRRLTFYFPDMLDICILFLLGITFIFVILSLYYLAKSYNNLFRGYKNVYFPKASELLKYEKDLVDYNNDLENANNKINFESYIIDEYVEFADQIAPINDQRAENLHRAKVIINALLFLEILGFILTFIKSVKNY